MIIYRALSGTKKLYASSESFQQLVGTPGDAIAALAFVTLPFGEAQELKPPRLIVMGPPDGGAFERSRVSTAHFLGDPLVITLMQMIIPKDTIENEGTTAYEVAGNIMEDLELLSSKGEQILGEAPMYLIRHNMVEGPDRIPDEERDIKLEGQDAIKNFSLWTMMWELEYRG